MTNKTVRPIMTVEARDALDKAHKLIGMNSRSESISALANLVTDANYMQRQMERTADAHYLLLTGKGVLSEVLTKEKEKTKRWKLIAWSMTAACVALIATMMITGV